MTAPEARSIPQEGGGYTEKNTRNKDKTRGGAAKMRLRPVDCMGEDQTSI